MAFGQRYFIRKHLFIVHRSSFIVHFSSFAGKISR